MSTCLLAVPAMCYAAQGFSCWYKNDPGHAVMYGSYALANCGLIYYEVTK